VEVVVVEVKGILVVMVLVEEEQVDSELELDYL
jgi:hypothetical protein